MDKLDPLPTSVLSKLICGVCSGYLSCGPIGVLPNGTSICGRCRTLAGAPPSITYMLLAKFFTYPCKYWKNGCGTLVNFTGIPRHEEKCKFGKSCQLFCSCPCTYFCRSPKLRLVKYNDANCIQLTEKIQDSIYCYNCQEFLTTGPLYILENGKDICFACGEGKKIPRNFALEIILDMFILHCIYVNRGCQKYFKFGKELHEHKNICEFGPPQPKNKFMGGDKERGVIQLPSGGHIFATIKQYDNQRSSFNNSNYYPEPTSPTSSSNYYKDQILNPNHLDQNNQRYNNDYPRTHENNYRNSQQPAYPNNGRFDPNHELQRQESARAKQRNSNQDQRRPKKPKAPDYKRENSTDKLPKVFKDGNKIKGVINTPRGPIFATITPNSAPEMYEKIQQGYKDKIHKDDGQKRQDFDTVSLASSEDSPVFHKPEYNNEIPAFHNYNNQRDRRNAESNDNKVHSSQIPRFNNVLSQFKMNQQNPKPYNDQPEKYGSIRIKSGVDY